MTEGVAIEVRVNRSPARMAFVLALLLTLIGYLVAAAAGAIASELPRGLVFGLAVFLFALLVTHVAGFLKFGAPIAILSPAGILQPSHSESVVPWDKVVEVVREYEEDKVVGIRYRLEPEFERGMKRNWYQRLVARTNPGGFLIPTAISDTDDDALAAYSHAMMYQSEATNV